MLQKKLHRPFATTIASLSTKYYRISQIKLLFSFQRYRKVG